ncbi:MAG: Fic family protein [Muribaculaceae bacterium]
MAAKYIWQNEDWPKMRWDDGKLVNLLSEVNQLRGTLLGCVSMFGMEQQNATLLEAMSQEMIHSAEIEGERLNRDSVRSSLARHLGLEYAGLAKSDHYTEGVVSVMLDATINYEFAINESRLFGWHAALFPNGYSGMYKIGVAQWRRGDSPMQVVSGSMGHEKVHYEAPESAEVPRMMKEFLAWVNDDALVIDPLVKAAVAHLWFVTIHPFDDGNGRICRTITELLLSRADGTSRRYYSLSSLFLKRRNDYYNNLGNAQNGGLDIIEWIFWFLSALKQALENALSDTKRVVDKIRFWDEYGSIELNPRQRKIINMMLDGFEGKLNSSKWYKINHCSQDTALRDITDLLRKGILRKSVMGGRSTSYELVTISK